MADTYDKAEIEESKGTQFGVYDQGLRKQDKLVVNQQFDRAEHLKPLKNAEGPRQAKLKTHHVNDFEDDDFKFNMGKHKDDSFNSPIKRDRDRKRTVSSSAVEGRENQLTPSFQPSNQDFLKRFKQTEGATLDMSVLTPLMQTFGMPLQAAPLSFLPNVPINADLVCNMLIK